MKKVEKAIKKTFKLDENGEIKFKDDFSSFALLITGKP